MEEFNIDIVHVLQNRDFSVLQKLVSHCYDFRAKIAAKIEDTTAYESECIEKIAQSGNKILELEQEVESLKSDIDTTKLQQKIIDKKITNSIKQQEKLEDEVNNAKVKRDSLSVEIVDLREESEQRKEQKLLTWKSIKLACHTYKQHLGFHIELINNKEQEQIKVSFFINNTNAKDKYFVQLLNCNNQWRVEQIQPTLKAEHLSNFEGIIDFSKQSEVLDVTALLCKLRETFVKYY
ncbi:uncharacterized protein LOC100740540 [Bombus impatiens]|uniref:Uncharacterized protein LOC100740540 n=1 Tax=Bombus impatiens TaxID=132113 RepID=A0A6P6FDN2_BOMIM|nr:uncharacterized protein LOC100740540 [Bombus impatiens]